LRNRSMAEYRLRLSPPSTERFFNPVTRYRSAASDEAYDSGVMNAPQVAAAPTSRSGTRCVIHEVHRACASSGCCTREKPENAEFSIGIRSRTGQSLLSPRLSSYRPVPYGRHVRPHASVVICTPHQCTGVGSECTCITLDPAVNDFINDRLIA